MTADTHLKYSEQMKTSNKAKKAGNFVTASSHKEPTLQPLLLKAKALHELNKQIAPFLDANLRDFCQVANIDRNRLVMLTASGTYATQLRFQTPEILKKFSSDTSLRRITEIQIKVRPAHHTAPPRRPRKVERLATETAELISDIANSCSDNKLKEVLLKIAKNTK